ncbi:predicted protein [Postia placenta Mad-698-R]|nr:predicted protein [Postia placenta Mad-698-R]
MFSAPPLCDDPTNHSVPILDLFQDEDDASISYMVMPFLRLVNEPPFNAVDEMLDCADQLLEGIRDCSYKKLMMNANALYPRGFHPVYDILLPDARTVAPYHSRSRVPVQYYYVDFGISVHIPPDVHPKLVTGAFGRDQEVPELSENVPYNPFKLDVFIIGNFFRREFHDVGGAGGAVRAAVNN